MRRDVCNEALVEGGGGLDGGRIAESCWRNIHEKLGPMIVTTVVTLVVTLVATVKGLFSLKLSAVVTLGCCFPSHLITLLVPGCT
jgi:hypothetical protein